MITEWYISSYLAVSLAKVLGDLGKPALRDVFGWLTESTLEHLEWKFHGIPGKLGNHRK